MVAIFVMIATVITDDTDCDRHDNIMVMAIIISDSGNVCDSSDSDNGDNNGDNNGDSNNMYLQGEQPSLGWPMQWTQ
jgi:hypothetical protein